MLLLNEIEPGVFGDVGSEKLVVALVPFVMRIADLPEAESREIADDFPYDHLIAEQRSLTDYRDHEYNARTIVQNHKTRSENVLYGTGSEIWTHPERLTHFIRKKRMIQAFAGMCYEKKTKKILKRG